MLGAHPRCICTPESPFKARVFRNLRKKGSATIDIATAFAMIRNSWRFRVWNLETPSVPGPEIGSYPDLILWLVKGYAEKAGKPDSHVWIDHTPANIEHADILIGLFPDAKFLHIVRDGRAVAASIVRLDWGANTIDRAAVSWVRKVSHYLAAESVLGHERIKQVKYEELIRQPEHTLTDICRFAGIDFQDRMLRGTGFKVPAYTASQHSLLGKAPEVERIYAWEKDLTPRQVEIFESIGGNLLQSLGYSLRYGTAARKMNFAEHVVSGIEETIRGKIVNKLKRRRRIRNGIA